MTWTIAHSQTFTTASSLALGLAPWEYHFETFLPTKGYTVTEDEMGGITTGAMGTNAHSKFYGVKKTLTNAFGATYEFNFIIELIFNYRYIANYPWTGVAGEGADINDYVLNTSSTSVGFNGTETWRWMETDESSDAFMALADGDRLCSHVFPASQIITSTMDPLVLPSLISHNNAHAWAQSIGAMYANLGGSNLAGDSYLLTPNFTWANSNNSGTVAVNDLSDMLLKINGTSSSSFNMAADSAASLQIGSKFYLDLYPSSSRSILLDTGLVDVGTFN
jgi:hypothetical protein